MANYRWARMAVNADPKPGRWILPLAVLGMVASACFFVRGSPSGPEQAADTGTTTAASDTTVPAKGEEGTGETPPTTAGEVDPETQAYLDGVTAILTSMQELHEEMSAVNGGFDADPRTVPYSEAVDRLSALAENTDGAVAELDALTPPEALATNHETIRTAVTTAAAAADEALEGLQSGDDGTRRREAVNAFDQAVSDLETAIGNARSAAGLAAPSTTSPDATTDTTEAAGDA